VAASIPWIMAAVQTFRSSASALPLLSSRKKVIDHGAESGAFFLLSPSQSDSEECE